METLLKHHSSIHAQASLSIGAQAMPTYVTERTYVESAHVKHLSYVSNARRGAERFGADVGSINASRDHQEQAHA